MLGEKDKMELHRNLIELYSSFQRSAQIPVELQERLSPPLLLCPTERWIENNNRVLIVGQETLGWDFGRGSYYQWDYPDLSSFKDFLKVGVSVEALIYGYKVFEFARQQPENYRSPFWQAYRQIRRNFDKEVDGIETSVLWTNLFRMSLDGGSVIKNASTEEQVIIRRETANLLLSEVKLLQPNIVLFFTGPDYNDMLCSEFAGLSLEKFGNYDTSRTAWVSHNALPPISLRTYHPNYLHYRHWKIVDEIEKAIVKKSHKKALKRDAAKSRRAT